MLIQVAEQKGGITYCINCVGLHPDQVVTRDLIRQRLIDPAQNVLHQTAILNLKKYLYVNKSCSMCGRTYDNQGEFDASWKLTAKRVKQEFDNAGIHGVDDKQVDQVVAKCRKSINFLIGNKKHIPKNKWEMLTFSGQLVLIITTAQETRSEKVQLRH